MPQFGSPFSELANCRKLTDEELVRAIRFVVAAEYEATQMYVQLAESTDNKLAVAVLKDIADEERVHAGEFLKLLYALAPDEEALYAKGARKRWLKSRIRNFSGHPSSAGITRRKPPRYGRLGRRSSI
jgi:rubrerythrin